jgi:two-component system response regulator PrrA
MSGSILVVEDDATLVRAITRNLAARGYTTRTAMTVAEAKMAIGEASPALLLLDIDLPDGSGWEILRHLRVLGRDDMAVLVMSALRPNPRLVHELHPTGVLEKPFPIESLLRHVAAVLDRPVDALPPDADGEG